MTSTDARAARLKPLGLQRLRILGCLGGDSPRQPHYLDPDPEDDVFDAFESFVQAMTERYASQTDPLSRSLLGAARLLVGDLSGAQTILDNLPAEPTHLDHGLGYCKLAPVHALAATLPLPAGWPSSSQWLAGSPHEQSLREWLEDHRHALRWQRIAGVYIVSRETPASDDAKPR